MKKIIIAVSMLASCLVAHAQEPTVAPTEKQYKPVAGDVLAELGFFGGGLTGANIYNLPTSTFGTPQLKFRYFLQDKMAIRIGFNISQNNETTRIYEATPGTGEGYAKTSNHLWGLNAGLEKHFNGTGRLSTYIGGDLSLQLTGAGEKWDNTADGVTFTNGSAQKVRGTNANGVSSFGLGARVFTGADYYFVDKVYLGAEFGWGFMGIKEGKTKTETTTAGTTTTVETKSAGGTFDLIPTLTAGLRIGYRF